MSEGNFSSLDRYWQIRNAVTAAKDAGISHLGERRELVINANSAIASKLSPDSEVLRNIPSVAKSDIRLEDPAVVDNMLHKYIELEIGGNDTFLVNAPHAAEPTHGDFRFVLNQRDIHVPHWRLRFAAFWVRKGIPPFTKLQKEMKGIRDDGLDEFTGEIAKGVAEQSNSSLIVAKKSRVTSDFNRFWPYGFKTREYSRSGRAAYYMATRSILLKKNLLDVSEKLKSKFINVAIHGMVDGNGYDVAVADLESAADREVIDQFTFQLQKKMSEVGLKGRVVLASKENLETKNYTGHRSLSVFRTEPTKETERQHAVFGENISNLQVEIAAKIRKNRKKRKLFITALAEVINEWDK